VRCSGSSWAPGGVLALANVAPEECAIQRLVDMATRRGTQAADPMLLVNTAVTAYGVLVRAALDMLGYFGGDPWPPLLPASEKERGEIQRS
jgi:4-hydroxy-2-oxoglutarate aldolase